MTFDPILLAGLLQKNDQELWATIRQIAEKSGISLPTGTPSPADMQQLRSILGSAPGTDYRKALNLLNRYRQGGEEEHG